MAFSTSISERDQEFIRTIDTWDINGLTHDVLHESFSGLELKQPKGRFQKFEDILARGEKIYELESPPLREEEIQNSDLPDFSNPVPFELQWIAGESFLQLLSTGLGRKVTAEETVGSLLYYLSPDAAALKSFLLSYNPNERVEAIMAEFQAIHGGLRLIGESDFLPVITDTHAARYYQAEGLERLQHYHQDGAVNKYTVKEYRMFLDCHEQLSEMYTPDQPVLLAGLGLSGAIGKSFSRRIFETGGWVYMPDKNFLSSIFSAAKIYLTLARGYKRNHKVQKGSEVHLPSGRIFVGQANMNDPLGFAEKVSAWKKEAPNHSELYLALLGFDEKQSIFSEVAQHFCAVHLKDEINGTLRLHYPLRVAKERVNEKEGLHFRNDTLPEQGTTEIIADQIKMGSDRLLLEGLGLSCIMPTGFLTGSEFRPGSSYHFARDLIELGISSSITPATNADLLATTFFSQQLLDGRVSTIECRRSVQFDGGIRKLPQPLFNIAKARGLKVPSMRG